MSKILALDPGVRNGVAVYAAGQYVTTIIKDPSDLFEFFRFGLDHVVIEKFAASSISKHGLHTVGLVGGAKMLSEYLSIPVTIQMPQQRLAFFEFAKTIVRRQGTDASVDDTHHHQADALAHLLRFQFEKDMVRVVKGRLLLRKEGESWVEIA